MTYIFIAFIFCVHRLSSECCKRDPAFNKLSVLLDNLNASEMCIGEKMCQEIQWLSYNKKKEEKL